MQPLNPRQRITLATGMTTPLKVFITAILIMFIGGGLFASAVAFGIALAADPATGNVTDQPLFGGDGQSPFDPSLTGLPDTGQLDQVGGFFTLATRLLGLCGLPFILLGIFMIIKVWRGARWLEGTVFTERGAFLRRSVDLSTAEIAMGGVNYTRHDDHGTHHVNSSVRVPAVAATDVRSGRTVKIPLRGQGLDLLPAFQLRALADAVDANRSPSADRARAIAAHLRALAADPLAY